MIIVVSPVVDTGGQLVAMATPVSYCRGRVHQSLLAQTGEQHTTQRGCALVASWADLSLSLPPSLSLSLFSPFSHHNVKLTTSTLYCPNMYLSLSLSPFLSPSLSLSPSLLSHHKR